MARIRKSPGLVAEALACEAIAKSIFCLDQQRRGETQQWHLIIAELRDFYRTTANVVMRDLDAAGFQIVPKP